MQAVVENLSGLSRKIKVTVPQDQINDEFNRRIKDLATKANIKGFRKGKVPASVVKLQYGDSVRHEVIQDVISQTLQQAFREQNLYPAGMPKIELKNFDENTPLEYEASFEVFPEVKVNIEGITVDKPTTQVAESNVNEVIEKLRKQNVNWVDVDRAADAGDLAVIDFEGFIDGEAFEGGSAKDFRLELGSKTMIPGFDDPIYKAKAGDTVEANVTFPEDYHSKQHAGRPAKFVIKIHKVMAAELPNLDDAFAKDLGVTKGTLEGLREEVQQNLERELAHRIRNKLKQQIIEKVLEKNDVEVPQGSVDQEVSRLQQQMQKQWSMQTGQKNAPLLPAEQFEGQARKNVILGLLLSQWIEDNQIKVDAEKVRARVDEIAAGYHQPHEIVNWYYSNEEALNEIQAAVLEEQAIDKIMEAIEVKEVTVPFDEIMNVSMQKGE